MVTPTTKKGSWKAVPESYTQWAPWDQRNKREINIIQRGKQQQQWSFLQRSSERLNEHELVGEGPGDHLSLQQRSLLFIMLSCQVSKRLLSPLSLAHSLPDGFIFHLPFVIPDLLKPGYGAFSKAPAFLLYFLSEGVLVWLSKSGRCSLISWMWWKVLNINLERLRP